jgi:AcrR family transcriptional regulator
MRDTSERPTPDGGPERLIRATISLLAEHGPSALKARTVASAAGVSTMVLYHHFGGVPELVRAVIERGFGDLERAFSQVPVTDDPIADLAVQALTCRRVARENRHLYDLMFGLSTRATYRPQTNSDAPLSGRSPAFRAAYAHVAQACARLVSSGRIRSNQDPDVLAAQLWSFVHGFITLELAETFLDCSNPVTQVLLPLGVNLSVGLGDTPERARSSHATAARLYDSITWTDSSPAAQR